MQHLNSGNFYNFGCFKSKVKKQINTITAFQFFQLIRFSTLILIGIVFTKTTLSQSEIGEYETFTFLAGAVSFFWLNGLLKALLPIARGEGGKTNIFSAFVTIQTLSVLAALLLFLSQPFFSSFLLNDKPVPEIRLLLVFIIFSVPANLVEYFYLIKKKNQSIIIYSIISFFLQFVLVVTPPILGYNILLSLKGLILSSVLRYIWLWVILIKNSEIYISAEFIKANLKLGGPLVIATLLSGSAQFVDGFIVTSKFDESTFAIFRYGARELPLAILLTNALSNAMLPEFSDKEKLQENLQKLKQNVTRLMHFLFPVTAVLLLVSHPVFPVIFSPEFEKSASVFNIYLLLIISRLMLPQTILNGLKITKEIMAASFFELAINVSLSLLLVNYYGIAGIAFATFIAYLLEKIYLTVVVSKKLGIRLKDYIPVSFYFIYSVGILIIFIFAEMIF